MLKNLLVRQAKDEDIRDVKRVVRESFHRPGKNENFNEWEFVDQVRSEPGFIPELCFVAVIDDKIVGYNLLTKAMVGNHQGLERIL